MGAQIWLVIAAIATACHFLSRYISPKYDAREPQPLSPTIPLIGHVVGILRHGLQYYGKIRGVVRPAFSMNMLNTKIYVVSSASLVPMIQRASKTISFDPFLSGAAERMAGIKKGDGLKLLQETESGGGGVNVAVVHAMKPSLLGSGLDKMNATMIKHLQRSIDELSASGGGPIDLHQWCRDAITVASSESVWGAKNPMRSKDLQEAFWEYDSNLTMLLFNTLPQIIARKPYKAREKIVQEFIKFYEAGGQWEASELAFARWKTQHDAGATTENIARLESSLCVGVLSNTVPATFWTLFEIFSRPELLAKLRQEVWENAVHVSVDADGNTVNIVDLADIRNKCTLLIATFQEVIRLRSNSASTRIVLDDIEINNQYLLKKGTMVHMPTLLINREESTWGSDAAEFNPLRFINGSNEKGSRLRPTGYLSWGSSPNMCPGRHFATGEILSTVAMFMARYDITPTSGSWRPPAINGSAIAASMSPPGEKFMVKFSVREGQDTAKWDFKVTEGQGKFKLVTG
ncbi:uncharacterized protein GIQ15_01780 [Arthroderma uncinatum]|uniref:uncharacterized protein n=1 Tax=Arthroderma uncinatum TaxID=74035 RepID=UPI00144A5CDB|nr:uncharacterized protein GIQ15_01780 [Arthroderma uncinatum]KAF3492263.1 hypothetical protein GIQ15_01780 [Arthroderma uncinatum]